MIINEALFVLNSNAPNLEWEKQKKLMLRVWKVINYVSYHFRVFRQFICNWKRNGKQNSDLAGKDLIERIEKLKF